MMGSTHTDGSFSPDDSDSADGWLGTIHTKPEYRDGCFDLRESWNSKQRKYKPKDG